MYGAMLSTVRVQDDVYVSPRGCDVYILFDRDRQRALPYGDVFTNVVFT